MSYTLPSNRLITKVREGASNIARNSPCHGYGHHEAVTVTGLYLASQTPKADPAVAFWFGIIHDLRREDEWSDPEHGPRAAAYLNGLTVGGLFLGLNVMQLDLLREAIEIHNGNGPVEDPTIGVCLDADRLQLPRVGVTPDPALMSTEAGKAAIGAGWEKLHRTEGDLRMMRHAYEAVLATLA